MDIGRDRIKAANLSNVTIIQDDIENYNEEFDLGLSLHACGYATDIVIDKCIQQQACIVSCSCCIGKIVHGRETPASISMSTIIGMREYKSLAKAADFGHRDLDQYNALDKQRRIGKCFVELDRQMYMREGGLESRLVLMLPASASPKNDILVGWPRELDSAIARHYNSNSNNGSSAARRGAKGHARRSRRSTASLGRPRSRPRPAPG